MSEEILMLNSGIQTIVPQLATPQVVYLDFDGAKASYYNRDLDIAIDNITVEDSGFNSETISVIVATLNEQFDDAVFTSDLPTDSQFSTIYIGVTSAFDEYGSFLGLAETIDFGNQIHDDNAFVLLDSTANTDLLITIIEHQVINIFYGVESYYNDIEQYADIVIPNGHVMSGSSFNAAWIFVMSGGMAVSISGKNGYLYIYNGASAISNSFDFGNLEVYDGGTALDNRLNSGFLEVYDGGMAVSNTFISDGYLTVFSGGTASTTTFRDGGSVEVFEGGTANNITFRSGGSLEVSAGGTVSNTNFNAEGSVTVWNDGNAIKTTFSSEGSLSVNGGTVDTVIFTSGGYLNVWDSGIVKNVTFGSDGYLDAYDGIVDTVMFTSGGNLCVYDDAMAINPTVNHGGIITVMDGTISSATINSGGSLMVSGEGRVTGVLLIVPGGNVVFDSGSILEFDISSRSPSSTALVNNLSLVSGTPDYILTVSSSQAVGIYKLADGASDFADNIQIIDDNDETYGVISVGETLEHENGTFYSLNSSNGSLLLSVLGGQPDLSLESCSYKSLSGTPCIELIAVVANSSLVPAESSWVYFSMGGLVKSAYCEALGPDDISIVSASFYGLTAGQTYEAVVTIDAEGEVTELDESNNSGSMMVKVADNGDLIVASSQVSNVIIQDGSGMQVLNGGVTDRTAVNDGWLLVNSGGTADSTTVDIFGSLYVLKGGVASNTKMEYGYLFVTNGGVVDCTNNEGGKMLIESTGSANRTSLGLSGVMDVLNGGTASSTSILYRGTMGIYSGGTANNIIVNSKGYMHVFSGGTALAVSNKGGVVAVDVTNDSQTIVSGINQDGTEFYVNGSIAYNVNGRLEVFSGGTTLSTTLNSNGCIWVSSGGTSIDNTVNLNGAMYIFYDGIALSTIVDLGGYACVQYGGMLLSTTVKSGGSINVLKGGSVLGTTVNSGGILRLFEGGAITGHLSIASGGSVSFDSGSVLNFDISSNSPSSNALVNNLSLVSGSPDYTLTVSSSQASGNYALADGASGFTGYITVKDTSSNVYGSISVGETLKYKNDTFGLYSSDGTLILSVSKDLPDLVFASNWTWGYGHSLGSPDVTLLVGVTNVGSGLAGSSLVHFSMGGMVSSGYCEPLAPGEFTVVSASFYGLTVGETYTALITADAGGEVMELDESNNTGNMLVEMSENANSKPDLALVSSGYNYITGATEVSLYADVANIGSASTGNSWVYFSMGGMVKSSYCAPLAQGQSTAVSASFSGLSLGSTYTALVIVDGAGQVTELNESNNSAFISVQIAESADSKPDLILVSSGYDYMAGLTGVTLNAKVANIGSSAAESSWVYFSLGGVVKSSYCGSLAPGESSGVSATFSGLQLGSSYTAVIAADGAAQVAELNESNNTGQMTVKLTENANSKPDLILPSQYWGYGHNPGSPDVTLYKYVANVGTAAADSTLVYFSMGGIVKSSYCGPLAPGGSSRVSASFTGMTVGSTYTALIQADGGEQVSELNESNNMGSMRVEMSDAEVRLFDAQGKRVDIGYIVFDDITVSSGYQMYVYDMGVAANTNVTSDGKLIIYSGGCVFDAIVNVGGTMVLYSSGIAGSATVLSNGTMTVNRGGMASSVDVESGGHLILDSNAKIRGNIRVAGAVTISGYVDASGASVVLMADKRRTGDYAIINNLSLISDATYTITVSASQETGTYHLASGASSFNNAMTIKNIFGSNYGTLVLGKSITAANNIYLMRKDNEGNLYLDVKNIDSIAPVITSVSLIQGTDNYTFTASVSATDDTTAEFNLSFLIKSATTLEGLSNATAIFGKSFTLSESDATQTCYCQVGVSDEAGNTTWSEAMEFTVKDVTSPTITDIHASVTPQNEGKVVVTARFEDNSGNLSKEYRIDDGDWQSYSSDGILMTTNGTVTFRATDGAGNSVTASYEVTKIIDNVAPTIEAVTCSQGENDYTFTVKVDSDDNISPKDRLTYEVKYGPIMDEQSSQEMESTIGSSFTLSEADVKKEYFVQVVAIDESGNKSASFVQYFIVNDATSPTVSGRPTASVTGQGVTFAWNAATDNDQSADAIIKYTILVKNNELINGEPTYNQTITITNCPSDGNLEYTLYNLSEGIYSYKIMASDATGNVSDYQNDYEQFSIEIAEPALELGDSTFLWSGNTEYAYVQMPGLCKSSFNLTLTGTGEKGYMWTDKSIVDAEKDSESATNYYKYLQSCWAATAANLIVRAGWNGDIFAISTEDQLLEYLIDNFSLTRYYVSNGVLYNGLDGYRTENGVEWILGGYYDSAWQNNGVRPLNKVTGGFYTDAFSVSPTETGVLQASQIVLNATLKDETGKVVYQGDCAIVYTGKGYNKYSYMEPDTSIALFDSAFDRLKDGDSIGVSVGWYNTSTYIRNGGHAIALYGFTYDVSKAGTPGYYTGLIVADSDDDFYKVSDEDNSIHHLNEQPASDSPNRIKILPIEYSETKKVYVFTDYGKNGNSVGVVEGFQCLTRRPANITCSLSPCVDFAKNSKWNSSYHIGLSEETACSSVNCINITTTDDVYVALSLENRGLGESDGITIIAVIDEDSENAMTFQFDKTLEYRESVSDIVLNLGRLNLGTHKIIVSILNDGESNDLTIPRVNIKPASPNNTNQQAVNAGEIVGGITLGNGDVLTVMASGHTDGIVVNSDGEQIVKADGVARGTLVNDGLLTVETGGTVDGTYFSSGTLFAELGATVINTTVIKNGFMSVDFNGSVASTTVNGTMMVLNGTAEGNTVKEDGTIIVLNTGVAKGSIVADYGKLEVASGGYAEVNSFTGHHTGQYVVGTGSLAYHNIFEDGASQNVSGGMVEKSEFSNYSVQYLFNGAVAIQTELIGESCQYIYKSAAYSTIVENGCKSYVFDGGLSVECIVKAGGLLDVGDYYVTDDNLKFGVGAVRSLTVEYGGKASLQNGAVVSGANRIAGTLEVTGDVTGTMMGVDDSSPSISFDFTNRKPGDAIMVTNIAKLNGLHLSIILNEEQETGVFRFATKGMADYSASFTVIGNNGELYGTLTAGAEVVVGNRIITLLETVVDISLSVTDRNSQYSQYEIPASSLKADDYSLSWAHIADSDGYVVELSRDNFQTSVTINTSDEAISLNNLPYDIQWRVRSRKSDVWTMGEVLKSNISDDCSLVKASKNWQLDVLFVHPTGTWEEGYQAMHCGEVFTWNGTGETVALNGKNRLSNIFEASSDANVLLLTDDVNGDALFIDDIYSAFPDDLSAQARIAKIDEIQAGEGDDLIDLTSQRFSYVGDGLMVRGGLGDDVIWANKGENWLFGDAGDDRIVGASGDDTIIGGNGNDTLHGGGGNDIFVFGDNWGKDIVEQHPTGKITLWFAQGDISNWNENRLTYTEGDNSVVVSGVLRDSISLIFGDNGSTKYQELLVAQAFNEFTSEMVFEEANRGMLA